MFKNCDVLIAFFLIAAVPANAKTYYVQDDGTSNVCTQATPCGIGTALILSAVGDTIVCVGPVTSVGQDITKSLDIDCSNARLTVRDGTGDNLVMFTINIPPSASDAMRTVRLRGFTLNGLSGSPAVRFRRDGIEIISAAAVHLDDCVIANFAQRGIYDHRTGSQSRLFVKNCEISGSAGPGIVAASQGPAVTVLDNVSLLNNGYGLAAATGNNVVITRSTISGNTTAGIHADGGAQINVVNNTLSHNTVNLNAYGTIRLQENAIQFSNVAIQGGGARSAGANRFLGNVALGSTPVSVSGAPADVLD